MMYSYDHFALHGIHPLFVIKPPYMAMLYIHNIRMEVEEDLKQTKMAIQDIQKGHFLYDHIQ